jgi:hypothetical protein
MKVKPLFVEHVVCHPQGAAGVAFKRDLAKDPDQNAEYRGLSGHAEKAEFRAKWAKVKLEEAELQLQKLQTTKCESHTQETVAVGTYLPFKKIWDMEGSDQEGYAALRGIQRGTDCNIVAPSSMAHVCTTTAKTVT